MAVSRRLNRTRVVEAAVDMADAVGQPSAVTLTALAESLDIRVPSLYNHVAGLEDLNQAMAIYGVQALISDLRQATAGRTGFEALLSVADGYRRYANQHPGIYPLTIRAPDPEEETLASLAEELLQMMLLLFSSLGIEGDEALHTIRGFRSLLHGFVSLEAAEGFKMALDRETSYQSMVISYLRGCGLNDSAIRPWPSSPESPDA